MSKLALLVRGRPIDSFYYDRKTYVEGRRGTPYEIQFYNDSNSRRKIVVSVDGLNVMTGDSTWARGYIVEPYQTISIPGWRKNSDVVAAFEFASLKDSYNQHNKSGRESSVGVIGCKVFKEKVKPVPITYHYHYDYRPWPYYSPWIYGKNIIPLTGGGWGGVNYQSQNFVGLASSGVTDSVSYTPTASFNAAQTDSAFGACDNQNTTKAIINDSPLTDPLGTGWGANTAFKTVSVEFEAESSPCETLILYYDSYEGLKRRGVPVREPIKTFTNPDPFPGDGCPNPINL